MGDYQSPLPERNPVTEKAHRRQTRWQILLPVVVGFILLLIPAVILPMGGDASVSRWADISLIWLLLPVLLLIFVFTVVMAGLAYLLFRVYRIVPGFALRAQNLIAVAGMKVRQASDAAAEPIMRAQSFSAGVGAAWGTFRGNTRRGPHLD